MGVCFSKFRMEVSTFVIRNILSEMYSTSLIVLYLYRPEVKRI